MSIKITTVNHYYINNSNVTGNTDVGKVNKKSVITDFREVSTAVNKGKLTVDGVTLELSDEVRDAIKSADEQRMKDSEAVSMMNMLIHNANVAKQSSEAMEKTMKDEARALEIARRIARGGRVPFQDEKLLMDYNPEIYQMAKMSAMYAKKHEKYDTLIEEDSDKSDYNDEDEGTDNTRYQVEVDVSMGDVPTVEGVSEVAISES